MLASFRLKNGLRKSVRHTALKPSHWPLVSVLLSPRMWDFEKFSHPIAYVCYSGAVLRISQSNSLRLIKDVGLLCSTRAYYTISSNYVVSDVWFRYQSVIVKLLSQEGKRLSSPLSYCHACSNRTNWRTYVYCTYRCYVLSRSFQLSCTCPLLHVWQQTTWTRVALQRC